MSYTAKKKLHLIARNEGKIKSYDSCIDVRGWSHDQQTRGNYLRDWMRSEMPICVIPVNTLVGFLKNMTRRNHLKFTPRCHPNCKSKLILESICTSCHAIRECLKNDETFQKYFQDEELETSHWPCDKCLDALKSIKMFWRIILDKIFGLRVEMNDHDYSYCNFCTSVHSVAKNYLEEINEQTIFLKKYIPAKNKYKNNENNNKSDTLRFKIYSDDFVILTPKESKHTIIMEDKCVGTESNKTVKDNKCRKVSRGVSVEYKTVDFGCEACDFKDGDVDAYKNNVNYLQKRIDLQNLEMDKLTKENISMKLELQQIYRTNTWNTTYSNRPNFVPYEKAIENIPRPFESCEEEDNSLLTKSIDSEMIITLKNCKDETYTNISLLQVIHKSKSSAVKQMKRRCCKQEDPINLLTKVHDTFGSIVQREIAIVNENKSANKNSTIINSEYSNVNADKSGPSGSSLSLHSVSSGTVFVSTTE